MSRPKQPLRFELTVFRCSDETLERECCRIGRDQEEKVRFSLWALAGSLMQVRAHNLRAARIAVRRLRVAWEAHCQGDITASWLNLTEAARACDWIKASAMQREIEIFRRRQSERARKARKGPSDEEILRHRAAHLLRYGTPRGWQKRAVVELDIPERTLRARLDRIRQ